MQAAQRGAAQKQSTSGPRTLGLKHARHVAELNHSSTATVRALLVPGSPRSLARRVPNSCSTRVTSPPSSLAPALAPALAPDDLQPSTTSPSAPSAPSAPLRPPQSSLLPRLPRPLSPPAPAHTALHLPARPPARPSSAARARLARLALPFLFPTTSVPAPVPCSPPAHPPTPHPRPSITSPQP